MARGHQKFQSQQKNAKKQAEIKKSKGHDQKAAAKAALVYMCTVCRTQMPDPKTFKQHFESKHPKSAMPPELVDVEVGVVKFYSWQTLPWHSFFSYSSHRAL
ncbi:zinc finger protein 706-like [Xiphias gladius]|uniref:zinc finger protein 706-like n=1 Tax=Xiphias gladius TaxID=8245 RepID=UPI001A983A9A|nr:zinc finger protein 706-like [Xiphias gladius]XP_039974596.1 zinc finger protein 706-like [Xiphias gladius]XP_039974597.1 zinc finger protein 706-like [Xiphias gladius]XP_039974598.1 zinc finger protein 706-like [Xiphias gladius]